MGASEVEAGGAGRQRLLQLVEEAFAPYRSNPKLYHHVQIVPAQSCTKKDITDFLAWLDVPPPPADPAAPADTALIVPMRLLGSGALVQPHGHPGLCERQGRPHRLHAANRAGARHPRHSRELRGAGFRALEPGIRAAVRSHGVGRVSGACSTRSRSVGWVCPRRSRAPSSSSSRTTRPMSPDRPSASTAATGCSAEVADGDVL